VNRLFIELYLDEDVSVLVADLVRNHGFVASTTRAAGMLSRDDPEQLAYAVAGKMAVVTHNRKHYEALATEYFTTGRTHCGIIIAARRPPYQLARLLLNILNSVTAYEMENQLLYL
jgi:predicted nuclease of predicted toxin-antitoxin system